MLTYALVENELAGSLWQQNRSIVRGSVE